MEWMKFTEAQVLAVSTDECFINMKMINDNQIVQDDRLERAERQAKIDARKNSRK